MSPFYVKDCALATIATGVKARTLIELRDKLSIIHPSSIYFHFWGGRLRTSFEHKEYHNDFALWVHDYLHDDFLAERMELLNPHEFEDIEALRSELIELIDDRLDEIELIPWVKSNEQFHFVKSKIIIFQTKYQINEPSDFIKVIPLLTHSSLFYHVIDAARRTPNQTNDFSEWLSVNPEYENLSESIKQIDPYLISLEDLQKKLIEISEAYFLK